MELMDMESVEEEEPAMDELKEMEDERRREGEEEEMALYHVNIENNAYLTYGGAHNIYM